LTAYTNEFHAFFESDVSVRYVHGGLNRLGFRTELVLTPFSLADILDRRPSTLLGNNSPVHVTIVLDGVVVVLHPRLPTDVAAFSVGVFCAYSTALDGFGLAVSGCDARMQVDKSGRSASRRFVIDLLIF